MRIRVIQQFPAVLFALVGVSALASLPQVESSWNGVKEVYGEQDFGLRILRELTLLLTVAYAALDRRFWRTLADPKVSVLLLVIVSYGLFEFGYALYLGLPPIVPLAGLRVFEYLPLALIGFMLAREGAGDDVLTHFTRLLRFYVAVQAVLAVAQALWAPPLFGVSMLGGGRPFGTFVSPNLFGAAMATCTLFFALADHRRPRATPNLLPPLGEGGPEGRTRAAGISPETEGMGWWMGLSLFLALLSGSRTALLSALLVVFFTACGKVRARDRWALWLPAPLLAVAALLIASSPLVSGRDDADLTKEGRLVLWQRLLSTYINDAPDLLFGWGLGLGSNTINVLFGEDHFPGQFDSDSLYLFLLNGYGLLGLLAYLGFLWLSLRLSHHPRRHLALTFIFVAGLPFNLWEYFPQNAMLMFLWGMLLGTPHPSLRRAEEFANWWRDGRLQPGYRQESRP